VQTIEEVDKRLPATRLNGLSSVVAEAKVNGFLALYLVENPIDRFLS